MNAKKKLFSVTAGMVGLVLLGGGIAAASGVTLPFSGDGNTINGCYSSGGRLKEFLHAMTGLSMGAAQAIAEKFRWERHHIVLDVGAAEGCVPVQLPRRSGWHGHRHRAAPRPGTGYARNGDFHLAKTEDLQWPSAGLFS